MRQHRACKLLTSNRWGKNQRESDGVVSTIHSETEKVNENLPQNEAHPQFTFADLPEKLREELKTPTSPRCLLRADLGRALTWKNSRQRYVEAALLLSQLLYLAAYNKNQGPDGEIKVSFDDLEEYTSLSLYALALAYQYLVEIGAISDVRHHPKWPRFRVNWAKVIELMERGQSIREERTQRLKAKAQKRKEAAIARSAICHGTTYHDISQDRVQRHVAAYLNNPKTLFTGLELGIFEALASGPLTCETLADRLHLPGDSLQRLLTGLAALSLLERVGDGWGNTRSTQTLLVKSSPEFVGGLFGHFSNDLYPLWRYLPDAIRDNSARWQQAFGPEASQNAFETM